MSNLQTIQEAVTSDLEKVQTRILLWGDGERYARISTIINYLGMIGDAKVVGIVSNDDLCGTLDGYEIIEREKLAFHKIDVVVLCYDEGRLKEASNYVRQCCKSPNLVVIPYEILLLEGFTFEKYLRLLHANLSIMANNCWGGLVYHHFRLPFFSPLINMFESDLDYIHLLENLPETIHGDLHFEKMRYEPNLKREYPVFSLAGKSGIKILLNMNHYTDMEEAKFKFMERCKRINWNNLLIMMVVQDNHEDYEAKQIIERFHRLPYQNKIAFTKCESDYPEIVTVKWRINDKIEMIGQYTNGIAKGNYQHFDLWELLLNGKIVSRLGMQGSKGE